MSVVLITGASTGIGAALAREYHRRGWSVGLIARRQDLLDALVAELGDRAAAEAADVCDRAATVGAIRRIEAKLGPTDLLVANAGVGGFVRASALDEEAMDRAVNIFRVNVEGALNALYAVLPQMVARRSGHVAAVSSVAAWRGMPPTGPYNGSKAALTSLMEAFRVELAPHGVAVTTIHPGFVDTPLTQKNRFPMPFMLTVEDATARIIDGLARRRREINFPLIYSALMKLAKWMPNPIYDRVIPYFAPR